MPLTDKKTYRYVFKGERGFGWFIALLDETGFFAVISDYGNYVYKWSAFSGDFREFMLQCDDGYLISKLNPRRVADWDETYKAIKGHIVSERKGGFYHKETARGLLQLADKFHKEQSDFAFKDFLDAAGNEDCHTDWYEFYCQRPDPQVVGFTKRVFPKLKLMIKRDLEGAREPRREATAD